MRIVHINLFDQYGGAARIANQLIDYSRRQGHIVHQFVFNHTRKDDPFTLPVSRLPKDWQAGYERCERENGISDYFMPYLMSIIKNPIFKQADVVHLHCINGGYFSFLLLPFLGRKKLIWTIHDTTVYTAHCLYPHLCDRWQNDYCSPCPQDKENKLKNRALLQKIKGDIVNITPMAVVAPSHWIEDMLRQSMFKSRDVRLIYNGVDTSIYYPRDKAAMRQKLSLPKESFIIMFAAHGGLSSEMKGGKHMLAVLKMLQGKYSKAVFVHIGSPSNEAPEGLKLKTITYPYINDEVKLADLYSAADIFVSTSLTESFGLTVAEAMACGTPVAAFATGGLTEIIEQGKSGWLTPLRDEKALTKTIAKAIVQKAELRVFGENAAKRIREKFSLTLCCEAYARVYEEK